MQQRIRKLINCVILCSSCWLGIENANASVALPNDLVASHNLPVQNRNVKDQALKHDPTVGSLKGSFQVSPQGSANYSIPISVPPGTADIAPLLSIAYSSAQEGPMGNGLIGAGFSLQGLTAITRCPSNYAKNGRIHAVDYTDQDIYCFNGEPLVAVKGAYGQDNTEYRTYISSSTKIISYGREGNGPASFKIWTKGGQVADYALTDESRIHAQGKNSVAVWALNKITDAAGNYLIVHYAKDEAKGEFYPTEIDYTGNAKVGLTPYNAVKFIYEGRPDSHSWYQAGSKNTTDQRLHEIQVFSNSSLLYDYRLNYEISPNTYRSRLTSIQQCDASGVCLRPTTFSWQTNDKGWEWAPQFIPPTAFVDGDGNDLGVRLLDVHGTGLPELIQNSDSHVGAWRDTGFGWEDDTPYIFPGPIITDKKDTGARFISITGDGLTDILLNRSVWKNTGYSWQYMQQYDSPIPFVAGGGKDLGARIIDLQGKGLPGIIKSGGAWIWNGSNWQDVAQQYKSPVAFVNDDGADLGARILDFDGSGLSGIVQNNGDSVSAWINNGSNWQNASQYNPPHPLVRDFKWGDGNKIQGIDLGVRFVDFNADGLTGIIQQNDGVPANNGAWMNTGTEWLKLPQQYESPYPFVKVGNKFFGLLKIDDLGEHFEDFTGSGITGIIGSYDMINGSPSSFSGAWINNGSGWQNIPEYNPPCKFTRADPSYHWDNTPVWGKTTDLGARFVDLEGYGLPSIVQNNGTDKGAWLNKARKKPDYLIGVTDGYGAVLKIDYETLSSKKINVYTKEQNAAYPDMDVQGPMYVVYQTASNMGVTAAASKAKVLAANVKNAFDDNPLLHVTTYHYAGAKVNHLGLGFLGFHQVTTKDESTGINVTATYSSNYNQHTSGQLLNSETRLASGVLIASTQNIWELKTFGSGDSTYYAPYTKTVINKSFDLNGNITSTKTTNVSTDDFNNPVTIVSDIQNSDASEIYTTTTHNTYHNNVDKWLIGELAATTVTNSAPNSSDITRTSNYSYNADNGLLLSTIVEPNNPQYCVITTYTRDDFGNILSTTVSGLNDSFAPRTNKFSYDPTGRFVIKNINALNQATTAEYDPRFGKVLKATDVNNLITTNHYDNFGRAIATDYPDKTSQTISISWEQGVSNAAYAVTTQKTGSPTKVEYFDQANRRVAQTTEAPDGRIIWLNTYYDELSRVTQKSLPYYAGDIPLYINFEYDVLGRAVKVTHPDGTFTTNRYDGTTTVTKNALQQAQVKTSNVRDNVISIIDNGTGNTKYFYDAVGSLVKTIDAETFETKMIYDSYGHRTDIYDPDKGHWTYTYDPLGQLITQTDAMGQKTSFKYDLLGRMISRTDGAATSTWEYDTALYGIGKIAKVNGIANAKHDALAVIKAASEDLTDYSREYVYDELGRNTQTTVTVNNQPYVISNSFDDYGRPLTLTYPSGLQTVNHYNDFGYLNKIDNAKTGELYWKLNSVNAAGQITSETNANGLVTNYTYDSKTGFVTDIATKLSTALEAQQRLFPGITANHANKNSLKINDLQNEMQGFHYSYDVIGNMIKRMDDVNNATETFSYDEQNRLTQNSIVGGASTNYAYNRVGNITKKSDVGDYFYGEKNAGPHAVTRIISGQTSHAFQYNANGDQVSGTVHGVHRTISYTSFSKPKMLKQNNAITKFYYDADRNEIMRTDVSVAAGVTSSATTLYLGGYEITSESDGKQPATVKQKHYIGNSTLYIQSSDGKNGTYVLLKDNLGSVTDIADANANIVQHFTYTPFGEQKQTKGDVLNYPITHNGFTGHEEIESFNLVHMGGRLYDPVIGRFLSADPTVQAPTNPQDLNRYSYCVNNPLRFTDPSGFGIFDWVSDVFQSICDVISDMVNAVCDLVKAVFNSKFGGIFLQLAIGAMTQGLSLVAQMAWQAATAAAVAAASGGNFADVVMAAGIAFVSAGAWGKVGEICKPLKAAGGWGSNFAGNAESCMLHGAVGGTLNVVEGGSFKDGFLSSAVSDACSGFVNSIEKESTNQTAIMERSAASGVIGGTVAVVTGGNFVDGAKMAAFSQLFNEEAYKARQFADQEKLKELMGKNAVMIAERPLKGSGGLMFRSDFTNGNDLDLAHEEIFWTDNRGELHDAGYFEDGIRVGGDEISNLNKYEFESKVYHSQMSGGDFSLPGYDKNSYHLVQPSSAQHNCQNYVDAMRYKNDWS